MDRDESFLSVRSNIPHVGSDDEEESFVVLGTSSDNENSSNFPSMKEEVLPPLRTNKVHEMQNVIKMKISQINSESMPQLPAVIGALNPIASSPAKINLSPDSSYEEIQKQVEEVIKENEALKNIITQNNMSMKTQYDRCVSYKDEVNKVMKSYKDKFNEAKFCIEKLKDENVKLMSELDVYINIKKLHEEEIINLKEKVNDLKQNLLELASDPRGENSDLTTKFKDIQTELAETNLKLKELTEENNKLKNENKVLANEIVSKAKAEDSQSKQELSLLKDEKASLELKLLHTERNKTQREEELNKQIEDLQEQIKSLEMIIAASSQQSEKLADSEALVANYQKQVKMKDAEILTLKQNIEEAKFNESSLQDRITTLNAKIKSLEEKFDPRLEENYNQIRIHLSSAQATITALECEIEKKSREIEKQRQMLQESNAGKDEMFALQEQVSLFQKDFESEREAKVALKREKDQLVEDLQNLHKRNKQLQNEIERLRAINVPREEGYTCPKCSFGFNTYQSLENHVHRCLDLDGFP